MKLNIKNETSRLKSVVLGQPLSMGETPNITDAYDAKSYKSLQNNQYPTERDVVREMYAFENILLKYGVEVFRPEIIQDYNQVFSRDVAFVVDDKMIISNIIEDRADEQEAYKKIFEKVAWRDIINLPESAHIEGGDVIVWNDFLFIGTCYDENYKNFKTARTNQYAIETLKEYFPNRRIIDLDLKKDDKNPSNGVLHLDCTFMPIGKDKCILYKEGFVKEIDFKLLLGIFGEENCFVITSQEAEDLTTNIFSIDESTIVSDKYFVRLNNHIREKWNFTVEEISYREISKMGGLLRCSTMPLVREN